MFKIPLDASKCVEDKISRIEAAVHAVRTAFESDENEAALLVDATGQKAACPRIG